MKYKTSKLTKLNVSYPASTGRIGCMIDIDIVKDIKKTLINMNFA